MPKQIYNEGRVVGYSSYELYVKHHLAAYPNVPPVSEQEWLSSTLGSGSSMLLKIRKDSVIGPHYSDIQLPSTSNLCAASTIVATFFMGAGRYAQGSVWANAVIDYGSLISNDATSSPSGKITPTGLVPTQTLTGITRSQKAKLAEYAKIIDGIVIQPGTWSTNSSTYPAKDFQPDLSNPPRVRLYFNDSIAEDFEILLTGFSTRDVLSGISGLDGSANSTNPQDGAFLGPAEFPWANKIIFSAPNSILNLMLAGQYKRTILGTSANVKDQSIIDFNSCIPNDFYTTNYTSSTISFEVSSISGLNPGNSVLTTYNKLSSMPPALYGSYITAAGSNKLCPIDTVAPGTVKLFPAGTANQLSAFESTYQYNYGLSRDTNNVLHQLKVVSDGPDQLIPVANSFYSNLAYTNEVSGDAIAKCTIVQTGDTKTMSLCMEKGSGTQYPMTKNPAVTLTTTDSNIYWSALLECLANDKKLDILGDKLRSLKNGLPNIVVDGVINAKGTGTSTLGGPLNLGSNYIQFSNVRLYVDKTAPTGSDIPAGSIGIGW